MKVQQIKGLKLKIFCSYRQLDVEREFNEWAEEHPEYTIEDMVITSCGGNTTYLLVNIFYREPNTSKPPYRG